MLGNIQFIGHLFRQRMLTENIMHQCVRKLLENEATPKAEDLECLSKLLITIGGRQPPPAHLAARACAPAEMRRAHLCGGPLAAPLPAARRTTRRASGVRCAAAMRCSCWP
jgi:hypothetical protein